MKLAKVIKINEDKCVNCHKCIAVCPVKFCNDGSGDFIHLNEDLCIGCGRCIEACSHEARLIVDDFDEAMASLRRRENVVAIVAPAVASNFPDAYLNLNGWLKSAGVSAVFDVSFGAELTVKTYLDHVTKNNPKTVIAQPCPAIVTYIEIYHPELLPHLAPADSPMMHTMKMVKEFYPQYRNHKMLIVSPCIAKRREFDEVGIGDFNVTITKIQEHLTSNRINLKSYPASDYDNDPAERAVLFSTPGGLMRTAMREVPGIEESTRKIEGNIIYHYLDGLNEQIKKGRNPLIIDCLNCELGCNGGTGTPSQHKHEDELEYYVEQRKKDMMKYYTESGAKEIDLAKVQQTVNKYWKPNLYGRKYTNLSSNNTINIPDDRTITNVMRSMNKFNEDDIKNCASCGYNECKAMAIAVYHNLNKKENCHFYLSGQMDVMNEKRMKNMEMTTRELTKAASELNNIDHMIGDMGTQNEHLEDLMYSFTTINESIQKIAHTAVERKNSIHDLKKITQEGDAKITQTTQIISDVYTNVDKVLTIINIINDISSQTNLLALNAKIQAVHAGEYGKGFSVIADEIKKLANSTADNANKIHESLDGIIGQMKVANQSSNESKDAFDNIKEEINFTVVALNDIVTGVEKLVLDARDSLAKADGITSVSADLKRNSGDMMDKIRDINRVLKDLELSYYS